MSTEHPATPDVLVFVNDIHCGSTLGLCPPEFPTTDGGAYRHSLVQSWLWSVWTDAGYWIRENFPEYGLILLGDLIDGNHHHTIQILSADWKDHVTLAVNVLKPIADAAKATWAVRGTASHVGRWETVVASMLGAIPDQTGESCPPHLALRVRGCLVHMTHHMSVTSIKRLEAGGIGRALMDEVLNYADAGLEPPRVIVRGHRHVFGTYSNGRRLGIASPAWQFPSDYVHAKHPATIPQVGLVALDWRGKADGELPDVRTFLRSPRI